MDMKGGFQYTADDGRAGRCAIDVSATLSGTSISVSGSFCGQDVTLSASF